MEVCVTEPRGVVNYERKNFYSGGLWNFSTPIVLLSVLEIKAIAEWKFIFYLELTTQQRFSLYWHFLK